MEVRQSDKLQCRLRRTRAAARRGRRGGGSGPPDPEAQHRQPRAVRVRGAGRDPAGRHPQPADCAGIQRVARAVLGSHGGRAVLPAPGDRRGRRRRHLPRQRRQRAHLDDAAGVAQRRRRGADPGAGLPAVDRGDQPVRRPAVHYRCDESGRLVPDLADLASKVSDRTKALVVINPNNPTGAVYPREMLEALAEFARRNLRLMSGLVCRFG